MQDLAFGEGSTIAVSYQADCDYVFIPVFRTDGYRTSRSDLVEPPFACVYRTVAKTAVAISDDEVKTDSIKSAGDMGTVDRFN